MIVLGQHIRRFSHKPIPQNSIKNRVNRPRIVQIMQQILIEVWTLVRPHHLIKPYRYGNDWVRALLVRKFVQHSFEGRTF